MTHTFARLPAYIRQAYAPAVNEDTVLLAPCSLAGTKIAPVQRYGDALVTNVVTAAWQQKTPAQVMADVNAFVAACEG